MYTKALYFIAKAFIELQFIFLHII